MFKKILTTIVIALFLTTPALADFWADAGAPYKGVTINGVSESTPPSNYVKEVLAPAFTKATGIKVQFETTSWDQMYDKAIKDMEAKSGIYDFVYIVCAFYGLYSSHLCFGFVKFLRQGGKQGLINKAALP